MKYWSLFTEFITFNCTHSSQVLFTLQVGWALNQIAVPLSISSFILLIRWYSYMVLRRTTVNHSRTYFLSKFSQICKKIHNNVNFQWGIIILTEYCSVNYIRIGKSNFHWVLGILQQVDRHGNGFVRKHNITRIMEDDLNRKIRTLYWQKTGSPVLFLLQSLLKVNIERTWNL